MTALHAIALALTLGLLPSGGGAKDGVFVDALRGFRIDQPTGWTASETEDETFGHVLSLNPPGSKGERGVRVAILDAGGKTAKELADEKVRALKKSGREGLGKVERTQPQLGGEACGGLRIELTQAGTTYRLEQTLLVHDGLAYTVQFHAPALDFDQDAGELRAVAESFAWTERDPAALAESRREARLAQLAARCGNEVHWAKDWEEASARSAKTGKPVLCVVWFLQAFALDNTPRTTTFMDEDVIALVNARFVPLWVTDKSALKLHREGRGDYGMGPFTFGQALLVASADGNVIAETHSASAPVAAWPFLVEALDAADEGMPSAGQAERLEGPRFLIDNGDLEGAWRMLAGKAGWEASLERARIRRLERRYDEAIEILDRALAASALDVDGPEPRLELRLARAELLMAVGRIEEAQGEATAVGDASPELRSRALVDAGAAAFQLGDKSLAKSLLEEVVAAHPESRWASVAAVTLKSSLFDMDLELGFEPLDEAALGELLHRQDREVLPRAEAGAAATGALDWLLGHQLANGAFPDGSNLAHSKALGPNPFGDAGAALAGRALLAADAAGMQRGKEARGAAKRALDFVLKSIAAREATPPLVFYMDYMTWSDAVMLDFIADAVEAQLVKKETVLKAVHALLQDLAARQQKNGGWSYYKKNDLSAKEVPAQSISFTTAGVSSALSHVAAAGFDVPEGLRERSTQTLLELRDPAGVFAYFLYGSGVEPHPAIGDPRGDVGRGPACELALFAAGASDAKKLERSVEAFLDDAPLYTQQQGKALMHAGPQGQGCHYLYFDYLHAALVAARLPKSKRRRARILDLVLDGRQADGSFLDTPMNGHTYGTAMALRALLALDR